MKISGYAAVFDSPSEDLGGFKEIIKPGAFAESIRTLDPVLLRSHDSAQPLCRLSAGTLQLREDSVGLAFEADLPDVESGRDIFGLVKTGAFKSMSFGFSVMAAEDENWYQQRDGQIIREVFKLRLIEISAVCWPAYAASRVQARSLLATSTKPATTPYKAAAAARMRKKLIERGHASLAR